MCEFITSITGAGQVASDTIMSLVELCKEGDLEGVKAALQRGADVNTKDEDGWTGLNWAVARNHNSVIALLLKTERNPVRQSSMCSLLSSVDVNVQFNQFLISTVEGNNSRKWRHHVSG